jgi:excisionase family DNA binding protein
MHEVPTLHESGDKMSDQLLYDVPATAQKLGLGRSSTYNLIRSGALPSLKVGARRLVAAEDIFAFVQKLRAQQDDQPEVT